MEIGSLLCCSTAPCHAKFTSFVPLCKNVKPRCEASFLQNSSSKISRQKQSIPMFIKKRNAFQSICKARGKTISLTDDKSTMEIETPGDEIISSGEDEDDDLVLPVETLEEEAKTLAREHSLSLSRQLLLDEDSDDQRVDKRAQKRDKKSIKQQVPDHLLLKVAIVGRPNVGKSALFNRLVGGNVAIVLDEPGVTRDRLYGRSFWGENEFMVVDTGGVMTVPKSHSARTDGLSLTRGGSRDDIACAAREAIAAGLPSMIERQAAAAVEEASVIIFLVDGQTGVTAADIEIAEWLRKEHSDKRIILAVNKCESPRKGLMQAADFWSLGFTPLPISAISGTGTGELLDLVCSEIKLSEALQETDEIEDRIPAIAIVGKPNVGKSSILNALVGEERMIVSPVSGTTRDAIDTEITGPDGQKYRLIDTAGIRRRAAVASGGSKTESLSVNRAFRAIRRSDVVALVIDAMACVTEQDYRIGERVEIEGKACIIVVNKWDTIPDKNSQTTFFYEKDVREKLRVLDWAQIVYSSATTGQRIEKQQYGLLHLCSLSMMQSVFQIHTDVIWRNSCDQMWVSQEHQSVCCGAAKRRQRKK
ncbi:uncharacterized protein LOC131077226 isoform X2 [Cryptomeria japonica]|uniref:uncharacterized protein LOC131077226 isoform X2 n=1 Tax=Cryptomeria japonica TaxID=3369 RepID=UPI0025ABD0B4|nr:uncharacterized protein LOC131077226 isoform X2 [Cryptomeria japonica]